jgi:hypothetical protein
VICAVTRRASRRGSVARGYGVDPLPQTFFIRPDGTIASHVIRGLTKAEFKHELAKIGVT